MKTMINKTHIEGLLYDTNKLEQKVTGAGSKAPGTEFISGEIKIATDNACTNIVPVHFTYVTATTSKGKENATYKILKNIVDGNLKTVMADGKDKAAKLRIDSAIGLNEFITNDDKAEYVAAKRNEGGFVHTCDALAEDENTRNTFEEDIVISNVKEIEADEEKKLPAKVVVHGIVFDFRNAAMPIDLSVTNPKAMDYFLGLDASSANPVFTRVKGRQISETVIKQIVEESAFGEASVREVPNSHKDWVITWAQAEPYDFGDESALTVEELKKVLADYELHKAEVRKRDEDYKASKAANATTAANAGGFNF